MGDFLLASSLCLFLLSGTLGCGIFYALLTSKGVKDDEITMPNKYDRNSTIIPFMILVLAPIAIILCMLGYIQYQSKKHSYGLSLAANITAVLGYLTLGLFVNWYFNYTT